MKRKIIIWGFSVFVLIAISLLLMANNKNKINELTKKHADTKHEEEPHMGKDEHDHEKESHAKGDEHASEEEHSANSKVGPEKGILSASEKDGFELSKEAIRNFAFNTQKLIGNGPWSISLSALLYSQDEENIYRIRNNLIKRIDFDVIKKSNNDLLIRSQELIEGDIIITSNIGFIRIAELAAFGGAEEGHSH